MAKAEEKAKYFYHRPKGTVQLSYFLPVVAQASAQCHLVKDFCPNRGNMFIDYHRDIIRLRRCHVPYVAPTEPQLKISDYYKHEASMELN